MTDIEYTKLNKVLGYISVLIGMLTIYSNAYTVYDYIAHPYVLRLFWVPYDDLVIGIVLGTQLTLGGIFLILNKKLNHFLFNTLATGLIVFPILNFFEHWIEYEFLPRLLIFLLIFGIPALIILL